MLSTVYDISTLQQAILSPQGQITIPLEVRKALNLKPGAKLSVILRKMQDKVSAISIIPLSADSIDSSYGLGKNSYQKWGGAEKVLVEERRSWLKNGKKL